MFLHKLLSALDLGWLLLWANLCAVVRGCWRDPRQTLREFRQAAVRIWLVGHAGLCLRGKFRVTRLMRLCEASGVPRSRLARNLEAAVALAERDIGRQRYELAVATLTPHIEATPNHPRVGKCHGMRSQAHSWHGNYLQMIADLTRCAALRPRLARGFYYMANLAQIHGFRGETEPARRAMAAQCGAKPKDDPTAFLSKYLARWTKPYLEGLPLSGTVGVMFGAYHTAVGHAILDPFNFYNLFRHRFDHLVLIHPPLAGYGQPCKLIVSILGQHVEQLEVEDPELAFFAWQNLGEIPTRGRLTFLCYNYWALNRMAYHARRDPKHPLSHGRRYLELPPKLTDRAEVVCRNIELKIERPIVVLHVREHGYHRLRGQAYRNMEVRNYVPAIRRLIARGYVVIRVGDRTMTSIKPEVPEIIELPTLPGYDAALDSYFLSRCEFMISCQSGPCSIARALGKPTLVVNAVYNHTMLPERNELFAFKQYRDAQGNVLGVEEILDRGCLLFDRGLHYETAGVEIEDNTAAEILAATEEMIEVLDDPDRPDTSRQAAFRDLMRRFATSHKSHPLANPLTDYVGYSLPEGRVSDALCRMRPGYLPTRRLSPARVA